MSYIVLARKYRPQTFTEVYSQDHITRILSNAIKFKRIAHAYLFTGPRGVGKTSMARILAKSLNCVEGPTDKPCGICHNCLEIAAGTSPDVIEIDGASNTGVDDVRELQKELFYAPSQSTYKIYIIDEVHMLSKSAFNALLKTLEEPPENVIFVFATTEPLKVLPTIISRCQRFDFRSIPVEDITARLKEISLLENLDINEESLYLIARKSDGGMRDALSLLDQVISFADGPIRVNLVREVFSELPLVMHSNLLNCILSHDSKALISQYHDIISQGIDLLEFLNSFLEFLRQLVMLKIGIPPKGLIKDDMDLLNTLENSIQRNTLMYMITLMIQLKQDLKFSSHPTIMMEIALIRMSQLDEMEDLDKILQQLSSIPDAGAFLQKIPVAQPSPEPEQKTQVQTPSKDETIELDYAPPAKVKELTKEYVLKNWDKFINKIKSDKRMLAVYLKKENITNVKSDIIFIEFNSTIQYNMVNDAKEELNELLSKFFDLPVKLITKLNESSKNEVKHTPTLQEIKETNPNLAKLIEMTDSMIVSDSEGKRH